MGSVVDREGVECGGWVDVFGLGSVVDGGVYWRVVEGECGEGRVW